MQLYNWIEIIVILMIYYVDQFPKMKYFYILLMDSAPIYTADDIDTEASTYLGIHLCLIC